MNDSDALKCTQNFYDDVLTSSVPQMNTPSRPLEMYVPLIHCHKPSRPSKLKLKSKKERSVHVVRKMELLEKIATLEVRLAYLKGQTCTGKHQNRILHPRVQNTILRNATIDNQLYLASAQSMVSSFICAELAVPFHAYIHLTTVPEQRRATLQALKSQQLRMSRQYLQARTQHIDISRPHRVCEQFLTSVSNFCIVRFHLDQFPVALTSVTEVYETTLHYVSNMEIILTETMGDLVVREDDDSGDKSVSQFRLVTTLAPGLVIDSNSVFYQSYDANMNIGIVASTHIDRDDIYPYQVNERLRQDATTALMIYQVDDWIVLCRWSYIQLHHPSSVNITDDALLYAQQRSGMFSDIFTQLIQQRLNISEKVKL